MPSNMHYHVRRFPAHIQLAHIPMTNPPHPFHHWPSHTADLTEHLIWICKGQSWCLPRHLDLLCVLLLRLPLLLCLPKSFELRHSPLLDWSVEQNNYAIAICEYHDASVLIHVLLHPNILNGGSCGGWWEIKCAIIVKSNNFVAAMAYCHCYCETQWSLVPMRK